MSESAAERIGCPSTYGILICERSHTNRRSHRATLASGERIIWADGCDETCTADCGWCKGRLRRDMEAARVR